MTSEINTERKYLMQSGTFFEEKVLKYWYENQPIEET